MNRLDAVIIGAGQAGLAMSHVLSRAGIDHVVLERCRIAERWRSARWDSLRLLTPNWFSRLPGQSYDGPDPDGFMDMAETTGYLARYARSFGAPVVEFAPVTALRRHGAGFALETHAGRFGARCVILATGACDLPAVPACAARIDRRIAQLHSRDYRNPGALPAGGVLVVGASASGVQIARELRRAGRAVTLAAGRHTRVPRRWRGVDVIRLMDAAGVLDEGPRDVADPERSRHQPSLQLAGGTQALDLGVLRACGVRVTGRLADAVGTRVRFAGDLGDRTRAAAGKRLRLLERLDQAADRMGLPAAEAADYADLTLTAPEQACDLLREGIRSVVWATGFRRAFPWLHLPVTGPGGDIVTLGGQTAVPGFYTLGMPFQRRRKSTFIDGVGGDAHALLPKILSRLNPGRMAA